MSIEKTDTKPSSSLRMADIVIALLQRDEFSEAIDTIVTTIVFAVDNDMTTEEALGMLVSEIDALTPEPPRVAPLLPQLMGHSWERVIYGPAAFRNDAK